jgi:hypothetical protein
MKVLLVAFLTTLLTAGCTGGSMYVQQGVDAVKAAHNEQVEAGELLLCGSSLRAIVDVYASSPSKLEALLHLCDFEQIKVKGGVAE